MAKALKFRCDKSNAGLFQKGTNVLFKPLQPDDIAQIRFSPNIFFNRHANLWVPIAQHCQRRVGDLHAQTFYDPHCVQRTFDINQTPHPQDVARIIATNKA